METRILAMHKINKKSSHYKEVMAYMIENGAPVIRVCDNGNGLYALEGSHRIAAAHELGIMPEWDYVDAETALEDIEGIDFDTYQIEIEYEDEKITVAHMIGQSDEIYYNFEEIYYGGE